MFWIKTLCFAVSKHLRNLLRARLLLGMTHARSRVPTLTQRTPTVTHSQFVGGTPVDEFVVESPGLRRGCFWWGHGEGMPVSAEVGAWTTARNVVWEAQALRQRGRNPALALCLEIFGGLNKLLHSFNLLQAQAPGKKTTGFYPLLARRGLNLKLTLTIWPQLRPATTQNVRAQQNCPTHWL